ncbi:DUF3483 domain-containing protein [Acetobacter peroxydans]|uniref:DUF3483 domain-containing protein n=1 Tax=Acetobacter peroxydans TaxID=104098 RepID=UPI002356A784|nr:DUF3483 domain-containing protein [Acetobacter peroxydans]MCH4144149.1 (Fe-S)-binding protein [Acetobacter peroxydans]MCI1395760.1 (Fe-S)-binding protein [Acetobacter peroxydans]MCI1410973.1 (Fe-S)-binding protein [Acetobacter peroxydans]MCI1440502.1 (Fe-S)-binding protein [Acetobacter peroxydans]MCI1566232.1 (Fe-S)-binding protein [Acetobacter peroxydans]
MILTAAGLAWVLCVGALLVAGRYVMGWRQGRPAVIDWQAGLAALPRRYLKDVHDVVERRPGAGRMHALTAGGLMASVALALLGVLPFLQASRLYWGCVALFSVVGLAGAVLVWRRRWPHKPSFLSGGLFYAIAPAILCCLGGLWFLAVWAVVSDTQTGPVVWVGQVMTGAGGAALLWLLGAGPLKHAFSGATWLVTHTRPGRFGGGRDTALRGIALDAPMLGCIAPVDFSWNVLASFDACIQCGRCEQVCPAFAAGQRLNPKALIQGMAHAMHGGVYTGTPAPGAPAVTGQGGMSQAIVGEAGSIHPETLWACTTCRACVEECPMMIEHVDTIVDLRRGQALMHGAVRPGAATALRVLRDKGNLAGRAPAERAEGLAMLDVPVLAEGEETDILLWLGEGAFDRRYSQSLQALVKLMRHAGLRFAILGEAETDCGDLARRLGDEATFQMLAADVVTTLSRRRFNRIVTADPHAFHVLANEYPHLNDGRGASWMVQHHTTLLDELVQAGRLRLTARAGAPVAWHDPCYLGRYNGQTEAPRRLLAGACQTVVEMERHGLQAMCCGGGGGNPVSDVDARERIPDLRMAQARQAGAAVVAVGCPGCTAMLEGVVGEQPQVRDIAELVLAAVEEA